MKFHNDGTHDASSLKGPLTSHGVAVVANKITRAKNESSSAGFWIGVTNGDGGGTVTPGLKQLAFLTQHNCLTPIKPGYTINLNVLVVPHSYVAFFAYIPKTGFELNSSQSFSNVAAGGSEWVGHFDDLKLNLIYEVKKSWESSSHSKRRQHPAPWLNQWSSPTARRTDSPSPGAVMVCL